MTVEFVPEGQEFVALNGGPVFSFSPAISFVVNCRTQKEIDHYGEQTLSNRRGTTAVRLAGKTGTVSRGRWYRLNLRRC